MIRGDRPALDGEEIDITPQMIEAGRTILDNSGLLTHPGLSSEPLVVRDIFFAMWLHRKVGDKEPAG